MTKYISDALKILRSPQHPEHVAQAAALLDVNATLDDLWREHVAAGHVPEVWVIAALAWHLAHAATTDPLQGYSPDEIVVGAGGQTLAQAADAETNGRARREGLLPPTV